MAGADAVKQLKIKTSAVSRLMKDRVASDREIEGQKERIGKVRSDPEKDEHDVAKQARRPRRVAQRRTAADAEPPARPPVRRRRRCSPRWWPAGQTSCAGSRTLRSSSTLSWRAAGEPRRRGRAPEPCDAPPAAAGAHKGGPGLERGARERRGCVWAGGGHSQAGGGRARRLRSRRPPVGQHTRRTPSPSRALLDFCSRWASSGHSACEAHSLP